MAFLKTKTLEVVPDFPKLEKAIWLFWKKRNILKKYLKRNARAKKRFRFLDGPITANNPMGVHHAWGRTVKDLFQRFKTMQGYRQRYQNGFDAQGLWVEVEVEKELGFKTKKDIEKYGIAKFVEKCKARVRKFARVQTEQSKRLGYFMDWEHSYNTMSEENNYAIWHFLKTCYKKGYLFKGRDVVPWCPRCGTAISQHEILTEEYQELTHLSAYVRFPVRGSFDKLRTGSYLLVWTTTPWTLPVNAAVAVNPELSYVEVQKGEERYFLAEKRIDVLGGGKIVRRLKGKALVGIQYEGAFDDLPAVKGVAKHHRVVAWDGVGEEEGTGLVHIAPGAGEEDFDVGKEEGLASYGALDEAGVYVEGYGFLSGKSVKEATPLIVQDLEKRGFLFGREEFRHRYPVCWRCKTELVFRLVDEWYISMKELRPRLLEIAKTVRWLPSFGLERELDWLKNMGDWLISKKRYWGLALPIFECIKCGHFEVIGSKEELKKRAVAGWKQFEGKSPHRPYVDAVKIKCAKCGAVVSRIPDVGNPWLDAGIVPFSTMKYFEDRTYWREWFPAEFITESFPGQFKNWFYSLLVMSAVLENRASFETVLGYGTVLDERGESMHKSKGNMIEFNEAAEKVGADVLRVTYTLQNPSLDLLFGWKTLEQGKRDVLLLFWNVFRFFVTYSRVDRWTPKKRVASAHTLDRWILASLHRLIETVTAGLNEYDPAGPMRAIQAFISDLSTWYLRRSRRRRDAAFYSTIFEVLGTLLKVTAPFLPYMSEVMY
ncbi:isoleucine--tRNA ligase, partial [Candidatus Azambacteria bacterium]|nr:isoleucine--tRNA ligase [Candidatus Azambacteria bacterium]